MHRYSKLLLASLAATAILAMAVGNASANHISLTNRNIRVTWTSLRLSNTVNSNVVLCPVTLEGSFHETSIVKTVGALVGYITRASVSNPCTGGTATIHQESLPWHITYEGFVGTLPEIEKIKLLLIGIFFEIREASNTCSARTELEHPAIGFVNINRTTKVAESLTPEPNTRIPLTNGAGGIFCGLASGIFGEPSQTLTVLGSTTRITVTLI